MSDRIGMGLANFPFSDVETMWQWIDLCEDNEVDSIWQTDRLISREPILESMTFMAALAARTEKLKFGMNVVVVGFRDPLVLAKQCATIDFLSTAECCPHSASAARLRRSGMSPIVSYEAERQSPTRCWTSSTDSGTKNPSLTTVSTSPTTTPRSHRARCKTHCRSGSRAQQGRHSTHGADRTGWVAGVQSAHEVGPIIEQIKAALAEAGRTDYEPDHFGAGFAYHFGSWDDADVQDSITAIKRRLPDVDPATFYSVGTAEDILRRVNEYRAAGVSKFIMRPVARGTTRSCTSHSDCSTRCCLSSTRESRRALWVRRQRQIREGAFHTLDRSPLGRGGHALLLLQSGSRVGQDGRVAGNQRIAPGSQLGHRDRPIDPVTESRERPPSGVAVSRLGVDRSTGSNAERDAASHIPDPRAVKQGHLHRALGRQCELRRSATEGAGDSEASTGWTSHTAGTGRHRAQPRGCLEGRSAAIDFCAIEVQPASRPRVIDAGSRNRLDGNHIALQSACRGAESQSSRQTCRSR